MSGTFAQRGRNLTTSVRHASPWTWLLFTAIIAHVIVVTRLQWDIHRGLGTASYDVGLYDQGIWLLSRFEAPFVTLMGRNLMGDHASLILFFVVPLYWLIPGTETLLAMQAVVIAAGAIPIYFFARRFLNSSFLGFLFGVVWLVNPAVNGTNMENYHPDSFLGLLVPIAMVCALSKKWRGYWIALVLCLLVKEDVVLIVLPLGALIALRGDVRRGIITMGAGITASLAGMYLLMRSLIGVPTRNGWRIPFGGVWGFISETFTNPTNVYRYLTSEGRLMYLWKMFAPLALMSFLAPEVAAVSVLVIAFNVISNFWYQFHIEYHYSIVAVPALVLAAVVGAGRLPTRWKYGVVCIVAMSSLVAGYSWSYVPFRASELPHWGAQHPTAAAARDILKKLPEDAVISVQYSLAPHVAHRKEIYQFPNPFRTVLYGTDISREGERNPRADGVQYVVLPRQRDDEMAKDWALASADFEEFASNEHWQIFVRRSP